MAGLIYGIESTDHAPDNQPPALEKGLRQKQKGRGLLLLLLALLLWRSRERGSRRGGWGGVLASTPCWLRGAG